MPSFPSGAIEKLPWKELQPQVLLGDKRMSGHFAMSPLSRSLQRLRQQWNACEEWERYEASAEEDRARVRFARRIQTPECATEHQFPTRPTGEFEILHARAGPWETILEMHPRERIAQEESSQSGGRRDGVRDIGITVRPYPHCEGGEIRSDQPDNSVSPPKHRGQATTNTQTETHVSPGLQVIVPPPDVPYKYRQIYNQYLETRIRNL